MTDAVDVERLCHCENGDLYIHSGTNCYDCIERSMGGILEASVMTFILVYIFTNMRLRVPDLNLETSFSSWQINEPRAVQTFHLEILIQCLDGCRHSWQAAERPLLPRS